MKGALVRVALVLAFACDSGPARLPRAPENEQAARERPAPEHGEATEAAPAAPATAETAPPDAFASVANAGADRCVLGDAVEVGNAEGRALDVSLALASPERGLVVWSTDATHVRARPIGRGTELGAAVDSELGRARQMALLAPVGDRYLVLAPADMCNQDGSACVYARALSAEGQATGPQLEQPLSGEQQVAVEGWAPLPDGGVTSLATRWGGARAVRYRVAADGAVSAETIVECCGGAGPSEGPYPALVSNGEGVVVIGLHDGTLGDASPAYRLVRWPDPTEHVLSRIPYEARILAVAVDGDAVDIAFRPEEGPARVLRIDSQGRPTGRPAPIRRDDPLPASFGGRVVPRLEVAGERLLLHRVDSADREIGEPTEITRARVPLDAAAVAFSGRDFGVAYGEQDAGSWTVYFRRVSCAPAPDG